MELTQRIEYWEAEVNDVIYNVEVIYYEVGDSYHLAVTNEDGEVVDAPDELMEQIKINYPGAFK